MIEAQNVPDLVCQGEIGGDRGDDATGESLREGRASVQGRRRRRRDEIRHDVAPADAVHVREERGLRRRVLSAYAPADVDGGERYDRRICTEILRAHEIDEDPGARVEPLHRRNRAVDQA